MAREMVSASTGAMNSVLAKLAALEDDHKLRVKKSSITSLKQELVSMNSFLEQRADKEDLDPLVKRWTKQVREMTYDLEDLIDEIVVPWARLLRGRASSGRLRGVARLVKTAKLRRQCARLLQELKERVREASERRSRYEITDDPGDQMDLGSPSMSSKSNAVPIDRGPRVLSADADGVVGIDGLRRKLIEWLSPDGQHKVKVVSVVGPGGIGKTTLAMDVYRSLKGQFDCHAVISVSQRLDLTMILTSILSQVSAEEYAVRECDESQLIHKLREFLNTKRYFVIIDDIWDAQTWHLIRWAFPENDRGCRILVTTRISSIAKSCCNSNEDNILQMEPLSDVEARKLFFRRIFHSEDCPSRLKDISDEILKMCGGIPLAIITVASLLATKSVERDDEWKRVRDSIALALDESATLEGLRRILYFSYLDLPFHLRTCLLYLSIFPEDYIIDRARLIRRWMVEGFIIEEHGKSLEEVGECYFSELIDRGLIQPVGIQYDGRIKACQVQDMVLDLIMSKSAEENFVTLYDDPDCNFALQNRVRRLSLYCDYNQEGTSIPSAICTSHVRSLTIFMSNKEMPTLENYRALRVLDLESSGELEDDNYLQNIGRFYLLRYLRLQTTSVIDLPEQMGELQDLETLDLTRARISRLPRNIIQLRHLTYLLVCNVKLPDGIGELQALQELSHVQIDSSNSSSLQELGCLTMLRVLGLNWRISDTDNDMSICSDTLVSSLNKLGTSNLQSLHIESDFGCPLDFLLDSLSAPFDLLREFRMTSNYYFPRIPNWMASLVSLNLLQINIDIVGEEVLQILGKLPFLLVLLLSVKSIGPQQGLIIRSSEFQRLKQFDFVCWNSRVMLMFQPGTMLALEKLQLKFLAREACVHNYFDFGTEHLASLKHLCVDIVCKDAEPGEVEAVEDAIKSAFSTHPNHPRIELRRWQEEDMVMDEMEITVEGNGVEFEEMVEEELTGAVLGWGVSIAGWIISPLIAGLLNKAFSYSKSRKSETLHRGLTRTLPLLALTLEGVEGGKHMKPFEKLVGDLKSAFYNMEDILDEVEYMHHHKQLSSQRERKIASDDDGGPSNQRVGIQSSWTIPGSLNKRLKENMDEIEKLIEKAEETIERANLTSNNGSSKHRPNVTATYMQKNTTADPTGKVTGREEDRNRIIRMLRDAGDNVNPSSSDNIFLSVIGICGIPGSGKTTLAQHVCKFEERAGYFDHVMWIHISQKFSVDTIFREMFEAASGNKDPCPQYSNLDVLRKELERKLYNKRFLLVLDDIWCNKDASEQQLPQLLSPLKVGRRGSKILVTSRNADALSDLGPDVRCTTIPIPALNDSTFLELFMYYALGDRTADVRDKKMLRLIGADIAKKLKGSPLAARTVGGQLRVRQNVDFWRKVRDRDLLNETMGALWWSYQHLDAQVRRCFAYCSIFPRRHRLDRDELVNLWVAEGFIGTTNAWEEMEAVAQDCFDKLVSTSFLQPGGEFNGKGYYFVPDLLHALAEKVAGSDCFRIENGWTGEVSENVRHLFVETCNGSLITDKISKLENLRTLIISTGQNGIVSEEVFKKILKGLGFLGKLRVLVVKTSLRYRFFSFPESIGLLKHLRYLAFQTRGMPCITLPCALAKLYHMQVLDFGHCGKLEFSSGGDMNMSNLINLRHVISFADLDFPDKGRLTSLQTIPFFTVRKEQGYELKQLKHLNKLRGRLHIRGLEDVESKEEALEAKLADKERLTELALSWGDENRCCQEVQVEVLEGLGPPMLLERLEIRNYHGLRYPNWMVGKQYGERNLHELELHSCSRLVPVSEPFFSNLRSLMLMDCTWDTLPDNMEHLTLLKELLIYKCLNIRSLPTLPRSLEVFALWVCNEVFMRSCKTTGDPNWEKIKHIPKKHFEFNSDDDSDGFEGSTDVKIREVKAVKDAGKSAFSARPNQSRPQRRRWREEELQPTPAI